MNLRTIGTRALRLFPAVIAAAAFSIIPTAHAAGVTATTQAASKVVCTACVPTGGVAEAQPWHSTGNMTVPRVDHSSTVLPNGKVLVAGGTAGVPGHEAVVATAELYDPATGRWSATGSMHTAREGHTATLLQNGKVLVAGGDNFPTDIPSTELYDPTTGKWSVTGNIRRTTGLVFHTATLLNNGKVLVTGGQSAGAVTSIAELYDPATGFWGTTGSMNHPRQFHAATLLNDGRVLIAGGNADNLVFLNTAEIYDPATGVFHPAPNMNEFRNGPTATLLPNGKVLVAGGYNPTLGDLASAELFDPITSFWSRAGQMIGAPVTNAATLLPNGTVLVAGAAASGDTTSVTVYSPTTNTWGWITSPLTAYGGGHTASLLRSGQVLVAGGKNSSQDPVATAELYTP